MREFLVDYWKFIKENKAYWLLPMIFVLVLVGGLLLVSQGSAVAPFVYALF